MNGSWLLKSALTSGCFASLNGRLWLHRHASELTCGPYDVWFVFVATLAKEPEAHWFKGHGPRQRLPLQPKIR
jgi:hypothetical protein